MSQLSSRRILPFDGTHGSPRHGAVKGKGPTVLIIDDDLGADEHFQQMVVDGGFSVVSTADPEVGLERLKQVSPAAVILDLHMPGMNGLECLRRLRGEPLQSRVPVAILTGDYFLDEDVASEIRSLGARVFFKPVWGDDLQKIVRHLLAS